MTATLLPKKKGCTKELLRILQDAGIHEPEPHKPNDWRGIAADTPKEHALTVLHKLPGRPSLHHYLAENSPAPLIASAIIRKHKLPLIPTHLPTCLTNNIAFFPFTVTTNLLNMLYPLIPIDTTQTHLNAYVEAQPYSNNPLTKYHIALPLTQPQKHLLIMQTPARPYYTWLKIPTLEMFDELAEYIANNDNLLTTIFNHQNQHQ